MHCTALKTKTKKQKQTPYYKDKVEGSSFAYVTVQRLNVPMWERHKESGRTCDGETGMLPQVTYMFFTAVEKGCTVVKVRGYSAVLYLATLRWRSVGK